MSLHEWSYSTSLLWIMYIVFKCIVKWKSKGHTWNVKSNVSWKFIGSQTVMRVVKESPLVIYTSSLYEQRTLHLGSSCKTLERSASSLRSKEWLQCYTTRVNDVHCKQVSWKFYLITKAFKASMFFMRGLWMFVRLFCGCLYLMFSFTCAKIVELF